MTSTETTPQRPGDADAWRSSRPLYDALAPDYEDHFAAPHRRLYDDLAWERVTALLPASGHELVVDAGCGVGRWARRLVAAGHQVVGIEQSSGMLAALRDRPVGPGFTLVEGSMDEVAPPPRLAGRAGLVLAMGSLQYTPDPEATLQRLAAWLRPGGTLVVLVDSLLGLVLELLGSGRVDEARERLASRRGVWQQRGRAADLHLLDRCRLQEAFAAAGFSGIEAAGLLVSAAPRGRDGLLADLARDYASTLARERALADDPLLADVGKQLLVSGRLG
jgi:SAM-dependent methyltransferase